MDVSEQCGYSIRDQIQLFHSIKPLFANKLVFIVVNKVDVARPEDMDPSLQTELQALLKPGDVEMLQVSCSTTEGVTAVKNAACDRLLAERVSSKLKSGTNASGEATGRLGELLSRIHVAQPMGGVTRERYIPEAVKHMKKYDKNDPNRRKTERDIEADNGGPGVYDYPTSKNYLLADEEWKNDKLPEVWEGKNIYDYVDPEIDAKLAKLEEEEEKLEAEGFYNSDESDEDPEEANIRMKAELIREKRQLIRNDARLRKSLKNRAIIPRSAKSRKLSEIKQHISNIGYDPTSLANRAQTNTARARSAAASASGAGQTDADAADGDMNMMDLDETPKQALKRAISTARTTPATNRLTDGLKKPSTGVTDAKLESKAERLAKLSQKKRNRMARAGEGDRHTPAFLPKHLFSGKRPLGKTQRR